MDTSTIERTEPLYRQIASALGALARCRSDSANESQWSWASHWEAFIKRCELELPRGSGFDSYPVIDMDRSNDKRIVLTGSYHNMNSDGYYCGWSDYTVTVRPSFDGISLRIVGGNFEFKDYAHDCFDIALRAMFPVSHFYLAD